MAFTNIYLKSKTLSELQAVRASTINCLGPKPGRGQTVDGNGNTVPAKSDPNFYYLVMRMESPFPFSFVANDIVAATQAECEDACGVWEDGGL